MTLRSVVRRTLWTAATAAYRRSRKGSGYRPGLRLLMYHAVGTPVDGDVQAMYNVSPQLFAAHVVHIASRHAQQVVPLTHEALSADGFRIALTFDDGYADNLTVASESLVSVGLPFTVFVVTGFVAERRVGFLTRDGLRTLAGLPGATIGSHTVTHPRLAECDDRRIREELVASKAWLEDVLGSSVTSLSYPHGSVTRRVRSAAREAGYVVAVCSRSDVNAPSRDPLLLCRTGVWAGDDEHMLEAKLRGDWDWQRWRSRDPGSEP